MGTFNDGDSGSSIRTKLNTAIQKTEGTSAISTINVDGGAIDGVTLGTNSAVTEAQVDNININGNTISSTDTNGDVTIDPNGTGDVNVGNFKFDADQSVGAGQDNYVLTYDNSGGKISLEAASGGVGGSTGVDFNDNVKARFGTGNDLEIYHTGSSSFIDDVGDGSLAIRTNGFGVNIMTTTGTFMGQFSANGAATLYHNAATKFATTSSGVQTTGTLNVNGAYTLPTSDGSANQVLQTDGSGALSFAAVSGGGGADLYTANESSPSGQPSATGGNAIAIGDSAAASGDDGFAIGAATTASGLHSLAMINNSTASGQYSTSIGDQTVASGRSSIAMGYHGDATANFAVAIGNSSTGHGPQATALGAMALGGAKASGTDSFAVQNQDTSGNYGAQGANTIALGKTAKANGTFATAIGRESVSGGVDSVAIGRGVEASSEGAFAFGYKSKANVIGCFSFASGFFGSAVGDAQGRQYILRCDTTDATATVLTTDNGSASVFNCPRLDNDTVITFDGVITATQNGAQAYAGWKVEGLIVSDGGTVSMAASTVTAIQNTPSWGMTVTADDSNNILKITATGEAAHNIRWVANIRTVETTYA